MEKYFDELDCMWGSRKKFSLDIIMDRTDGLLGYSWVGMATNDEAKCSFFPDLKSLIRAFQ